jgi:hypothetical protein
MKLTEKEWKWYQNKLKNLERELEKKVVKRLTPSELETHLRKKRAKSAEKRWFAGWLRTEIRKGEKEEELRELRESMF